MSVVWTVARKELRELRRQPGTAAGLAGVVVLLGLSLAATVPRHARQETWKRTAAFDVRQQWLTQGQRHPHSAAHFGSYAFRPLLPTAAIEPGVSAYVGQVVPLITHQRALPLHPLADDLTSASRTVPLSPAFLALVLVPLVLILVGHRAVSGEREDGNLTALLASGVDPRRWLAGKLVALAAVCLVLVAAVSAVDAVALAAIAGTPSADRAAGTVLLHGLHAAIWVLLVIGVSARCRSSSASLALLLMLWVANAVVVPRVAASVGQLVVREPSAEQFRAAIQHDIAFTADGTPWVDTWSRQLVRETLERYGVGRVEDLPVGYAGIMLKASDAHYEAVFDEHFAALHALHRRQEAWHQGLSVFGPTIAARTVGQALAGTDLTHVQHFADAAERYRRVLVEATNDAIERFGTGTGWELRLGRGYWESIPDFAYATPDVWWSLRSHRLSLIVLAAWTMAAALFCWRGAAVIRA